jgi:hypothetical protein
MRRILIASLAILLIASAIEAYALSAAIQAVCGANSVASCSTAQDAEADATAATKSIGNSVNNIYFATQFVAGSTEDDQSAGDSNYTICKVVVRGYASAESSPLTITAYIYSDSTDAPGTLIGTGSTAVNVSSIGTSEEDVTFAGTLSAEVVNGTTYWLVLKADTTNAVYFKWAVETSGQTEHMYRATADPTWTEDGTVYSGKFTLYSN